MTAEVKRTKVAILIEQNVEDAEFQIPYNALNSAYAEITVLGSRTNETYTGKQGKVSIKADGTTTERTAQEFDAVIIPGGQAPDKMRTNMKTVRFVKDAIDAGKLVAAVCHGPQVLIEADALRGRRATGFRAIRQDMINAGTHYENAPLVEDKNLITSRRPSDLPLFASAILKRLNLNVRGLVPPDVNDLTAEWWKLAEEWGGQSKAEIVDLIDTAIRGERYALSAFESYADKASDNELKETFREICRSKERHITMLEGRLATLGATQSFQAAGAGALATLKSWLQSNADESLMLRAIGDLQTGVVDAFNTANQLTDPVTASIFDEIEIDLAKHEQIVADLYHARRKTENTTTQPTTHAAVTGS